MGQRSRGGARATTGALLAAVVLAGCGGSTPSAAPTATPPDAAASPLTVPLLSEPARPGMTEDEEIEGVARGYYAAVSGAANTGVLTELRAASVPGCPCRSVVDFLAGVYATGERLDRFGYQVGEVSEPRVQGDRATVLVTYRLSSYTRVGADGEVVEQYPDEPDTTVRMTLDRVGGRWLVAGIEVL